MSERRRSELSRDRIFDAAVAIAKQSGYAHLTIESIAARAGVGKQTIYRWWPSKGAVLLDAVMHLNNGRSGALPDTGDLRADLRAVLRATAAELRDPGFDRLLRSLTVAILTDEELAAHSRERLELPTRALKLARLESARAVGQLAHDADLELIVDMLFAPMSQRWMLRTGALDDAFADALVDSVLPHDS